MGLATPRYNEKEKGKEKEKIWVSRGYHDRGLSTSSKTPN
jgi:hypothetical protein